jgi:hypothetical protein
VINFNLTAQTGFDNGASISSYFGIACTMAATGHHIFMTVQVPVLARRPDPPVMRARMRPVRSAELDLRADGGFGFSLRVAVDGAGPCQGGIYNHAASQPDGRNSCSSMAQMVISAGWDWSPNGGAKRVPSRFHVVVMTMIFLCRSR